MILDLPTERHAAQDAWAARTAVVAHTEYCNCGKTFDSCTGYKFLNLNLKVKTR